MDRFDTLAKQLHAWSKNVPAKSLPRSGFKEDAIDVVEVCEVGIYLGDPVWNGEYDSADEESTPPFGQKRPQLHPGDYIVEDPR